MRRHASGSFCTRIVRRRGLLFGIVASVFVTLFGTASPAPAQQLEDRERSTATPYAWYYDVNTAVIGDWVARGYRIIDIEVASAAPFRVNAALTRNAGEYGKGWWWYTGVTASQVGEALSNNNARLVDLEPYDDGGGTTKFAVVMISNTGADAAAWSWQFNTSAPAIQDHLTQHPEDRLLDLDQYTFGQRSYYSAVYIRNQGNHARTWWWYTGIAVDHMDSAARANGAMIVEIEPTGTGTFNVIMQRVPGGNPAWWWYTGVDANVIGSALTQHNARPVSVKRWATRDGDRFAVVLVSNAGASAPPGGNPAGPPSTGTPAPGGGNGQLTFWTNANLGRIEVKVTGGNSGTLTQYYSSTPACGAPGTVTVTLPVGSQASYTASCVERDPFTGQSLLQWLGITDVAPGCTTILLTSQSTCSGGTGTGGGGVVPPGSGGGGGTVPTPGGGTTPPPGGGTTPRPGNNDWRTADVIFPKGTRSVRFHLDDLYTYAADRRVYVGMQMPGQVLGWATFVYPDSNVARGGKRNSDFYFGSAPITGVPNGPPLTDGAVWYLEITTQQVGLNDFFGFHGLDGVLRIDSPRPVLSGQSTPFKSALGQTVTLKFAVSPE